MRADDDASQGRSRRHRPGGRRLQPGDLRRQATAHRCPPTHHHARDQARGGGATARRWVSTPERVVPESSALD